MEKNDILTLNIVDTGSDGEGIAKPEGFVVFVPHALRGEVVEAKILKVNKSFAYAKLVKVLSPSPARAEPSCPAFFKCGGCHLMHMSRPAQGVFKRQTVQNCFAKAGVAAEVAVTVEGANELAYRNKLQLPVGAGKIGFFRGNSHDIVDIDICPVVGNDSQKLICALREYLAVSGDAAYDEAAHTGNIRHAVLRRGAADGSAALITIVVAGHKLKDEKALINILKGRFPDFGLYLNFNAKKSNVILGEKYKYICGREYLAGETLGIKYKITPAVFMQINDEIAGKIYAEAARMIGDSGVEAVIDAYSGISVLSAVVAGRAKQVYAIEINADSHAAAEELKRENSIKNFTNICGDTAVELPKLLSKTVAPDTTAVILDPPRKGCDPRVLDTLLTARPRQIIYISCNPATLARDLFALSAAYEITSATPYDMFPQTKHVETLICLTLKD